MADDLRGGNSGGGLRILHMAGECVDDVAGEVRAVGRGDRRALVAPEIIVNDEIVPIMGQHEVEAGALEIAVEDQVRVGNDERAIRHVTVRLGGKGIDVAIGGRSGTQAVQGNRGVKFASVIQSGHQKRS